jgi:hypothetical protein
MEKQNEIKSNQTVNKKREKYFIETIDIKRDTNMTRIYSVILPQNLNSQPNNQTQNQTT